MRNFLSTVAVASVLALAAPAIRAQDASSDWKQTVFLYGMGVAIDGDAQLGNLELPVSLNISDVFDALKFGGMAAYKIENDEWSVGGDVTYMNLGWNPSGQRNKVRGDLSIDQLTLMATVGRRITPHVEALGSLAYFDLSTDLEVRVLNQTARASRDADWIDPLLGLQYSTTFADKWSYVLRGDIGGFGVGSDFTFHFLTAVRRQNTESFSWFVGYRALGYDYEDGRFGTRDYQRYDLTQQGPLAGIAFSF